MSGRSSRGSASTAIEVPTYARGRRPRAMSAFATLVVVLGALAATAVPGARASASVTPLGTPAQPRSVSVSAPASTAGVPTPTHAGSTPERDDPALASAPADRLDRLAAALRRSPLAVDPELDWLIDAPMREQLLEALRGADVPVLVAVLPLVTEDESGGDGERVLRGLQQRLRRDAVYVVIDDRATIESSALGLRRDIDVPFDLRYPPIERRAEDAPRPDPFRTVPGRLAQLVRIVDAAPAATVPEPGVTRVRELSTLPSEYDYDDEDGGSPTAGIAVLLALLGATVGVGIVLVRERRAARALAREQAVARRAAADRARAARGRRAKERGCRHRRRRRSR